MKFSKIAVALMAVCIFANGDGENAKEFRDICQIYNILRQPIPKPTLKVGADPTGKDGTPEDLNAATTRIFNDIKQLNVSVIQPEIAQILEDSTDQGKWQKVSTDNSKKGYFPEDDETTFEELQNLYKKTTTDPQGEAFRKQCSLPLNEREKFRVRQVFAQLWKTARAKRREILNRAAAIENQRRTARNAAITALYGKTFATTSADRNAPDKALSAEPTEADFPMTAATAMSTQCKPNADVEDAPGGALVSDILCLCGADTARGHTICQSTAMAAMSNNHEKEKGAENWAKLKPKCEALQPTQPNTLTAQTLTNALTRLFAHLGSNQQGTAAAPQDHAKLGKNSRSILGLHVLDNTSPPGCDSSNGVNTFNAAPHGACIDYQNMLADKNGITWAGAAQQVIKELLDIDSTFSEARNYISEAQGIANQMRTILLLVPLSGPTAAGIGQTSSKQPKQEEQNKCKAAANKTAAGCAAIDCEYDNTTKECKPKTGSENAAAGTGVNCFSHTTKDACEAVNGDAPKDKKKVLDVLNASARIHVSL